VTDVRLELSISDCAIICYDVGAEILDRVFPGHLLFQNDTDKLKEKIGQTICIIRKSKTYVMINETKYFDNNTLFS
jgi:hypothetical protein